MRPSSSIMCLVGAVAVLLTLNGAESFALGRNVTVFLLDVDYPDSSNETTTDEHLDSLELNQNQTSIEDVHPDSLEISSPALLKQKDQANHTIAIDDLLIVDSLEVKDDLVKRNAPTGQLFIQQDGTNHAVQTGQHRFDNDRSVEDQVVISHQDFFLFLILEQQPIVGVFGHPLSDDLYLVKEYMGDYYFWEMDDELARAYLLQSIKMEDIPKFTNHLDARPKKLSAVHFAQFTSVQPTVMNDRIPAPSRAL